MELQLNHSLYVFLLIIFYIKINYEIPMNPITMMRNALGKSEGGSGVPLEREKYN